MKFVDLNINLLKILDLKIETCTEIESMEPLDHTVNSLIDTKLGRSQCKSLLI